MTTINKSIPYGANINALVDLMSNLPDHFQMDIEGELFRAIWTVKVNIQYVNLPKSCADYELQGHAIHVSTYAPRTKS